MVASGRPTSSTAKAIPNEIVPRMGIGPVRFSIDDALEMVHRAIPPEESTVELLDGELVYRDRFDLSEDQIVAADRC